MKIKTLLAIFITAAALVGLSVLAVETGKESSKPGTAKEALCSPGQTNADTPSVKTKGGAMISVENKDIMCGFKKAPKTETVKEVTKTGEGASGAAAAALKPEEEARKFKWHTDYKAALKLAQETKRPVFVEFIGSDWCGWCKKLEKEVTSQKPFQEYAKNNLVLFVADFPRQKKLSPEVKKQNEALAEKNEIEGLPTVLLLNAKGEVLARTGYQPGGAEAYVKHLQDLLKKAEEAKKPSA